MTARAVCYVRKSTADEGPEDMVSVALQANMAEREAQAHAVAPAAARDATKGGKEALARLGVFQGPAPYGFRNERRDAAGNITSDPAARSFLAVVPEEAAMIRRVYSDYAAGRGIHDMAREYNETARDLAPGKARHRKAHVRPGKTRRAEAWGWSVNGLYRIVSSPVYRGRNVYGRTVVSLPGDRGETTGRAVQTRRAATVDVPVPEWAEAVAIPAEVLAAVDARLAAVAAKVAEAKARVSAVGNTGKARESKSSALMGGAEGFVCGCCGSGFEVRAGSSWGGRPTYTSGGRRHKLGGCVSRVALRVEDADAAVLEALLGRVLAPDFERELSSMVSTAPANPAERWKAQYDAAKAGLSRLAKSVAAGRLTEEAEEEAARP